MFSKSPKLVKTIADAIAQKKWLVVTCRACKTISYTDPTRLPFLPNIEITALEAFWPCPSCNAVNGEFEVPNGVISITVE